MGPEIQRLLARLGDCHTGLQGAPPRQIPRTFYDFSDGMFVIDASADCGCIGDSRRPIGCHRRSGRFRRRSHGKAGEAVRSARNGGDLPPGRNARGGPSRDRRRRRAERGIGRAREPPATNGTNCAHWRDAHGEAGVAARLPRSSRNRACTPSRASWSGPVDDGAARARRTRPGREPRRFLDPTARIVAPGRMAQAGATPAGSERRAYGSSIPPV